MHFLVWLSAALTFIIICMSVIAQMYHFALKKSET